MTTEAPSVGHDLDGRILDAVSTYWGYDSLRPMQREAIVAGLQQRDSLTVLPTGGGKSLCYQVPPVVAGRMDVVVSPLISLMKDQVDGLRANGYPAAAIHSNLTPAERAEIREGLSRNAYRLLFVSPERLVQPRFLDYIARLNVSSFSIDEAHCISHWGHDFRPEYRRLAVLKQRFPGASVHAYTATATERVRDDIVRELGLRDPQVLVGRFDRPNLVYRVLPKTNVDAQVIDVLRRHPKEAAIVYCISRRETESLAATLEANGINATHYHAGLEKEERAAAQDAFASERIDVVVATVAFGMGIDRSNVRCVIHASMPKSIEHYQQETGRAGRDGLEAECVLLYSYGDAVRWRELLQKSAFQNEEAVASIEPQLELLDHMATYAGSLECRHRALTRYFGQTYEHPECGACDVCLDEVDAMPDSTVVAQKILSCVARTDQRYGIGYVAQVLCGADTQQVRQRGHDQVSTFGLLRDLPEKSITNLAYQLVDQGLLGRREGDYATVFLNSDSLAVLRGEREVKLTDPSGGAVHQSAAETQGWEGVDQALFDRLRHLRREIAEERGVPPYVIFGDETLRHLARMRPTSLDAMQSVRGVGQKKLRDLGPTFLEVIRAHCEENEVENDRLGAAPIVRPKATRPGRSESKRIAMEMFAQRASLEEVAAATGRAPSTVAGYLREYIEEARPESVSTWVEASIACGSGGKLKPIFEHLEGEVPYDVIRIVVTHQQARSDD